MAAAAAAPEEGVDAPAGDRGQASHLCNRVLAAPGAPAFRGALFLDAFKSWLFEKAADS